MEIKKSAIPKQSGSTNRTKRLIEILNEAGYKAKNFKLVLDAGCGYGDITIGLADHFTVMGVDVYKEGIINANSIARSLKLSSFFVQSSVEDLCFKNETFDLVVSYNVLEHVDHQEKMIKELYRVLNPKGVLFLCVPNKYWIFESHYHLPFLSWLPRGLADRYIRLFSKNDRYDAYPLSWWQLNRLLLKYFDIIDMTPFVLKNISKLYNGREYHNKFKYYGALLLSFMPIKFLEFFGRIFTEAFIVIGRPIKDQ